VLRKAGATVIEGANFTRINDYVQSDAETKGLEADIINNLASYLSNLVVNPTNVHSLEDVRTFTHSFPLEDWPDRDTAIWDDALALGYNNTSPQFWALHEENLAIGGPGGILGALERLKLDAVVALTSVSSPFPALVGAPIVTVPLGYWPDNTTVTNSSRGLVSKAPGIP
jgi:amidase